MPLSDLISVTSESGESVTAHGTRLTPRSQAIRLNLPFGGWVWNRPTGVVVERNGNQEYVPIVDITRIILLVLGVFVIGFSIQLASKQKEIH